MRIVLSGCWVYDGLVEKPVDIVALDYDWWNQMIEAEGGLEPNEQPGPFDESGLMYYIRFRFAGLKDKVHWVDSG